jgi:O-succinylbenzoate synthase
VRLPLVHTFETSSHAKAEIHHTLVELTDGSGAIGWGEIATPEDPYFCSETREQSWQVAVNYLTSAVLGTSWETPEELEAAWQKIRGNNFAKSGFSIAAWDLFSRQRGESLAECLGGTRTRVQAGVSLGIEPSIAALLRQVERHVKSGYQRIKLKVSPDWLLEPVRAVREAYPDVLLQVDANAAFDADDDSLALLRHLDEFDLSMIEQPFAPRNFLGHRKLQATMHTPLCLDETVVELNDIETMLELDAARIVNIKVSRMGGLTRARKAHSRCQEAGIPVWCGGMHEFGIGRAANLAISSLPNFTLPSDVSGSDKYYESDIISPEIRAQNGVVSLSQNPGIGYAVDTDKIARIADHIFERRCS